LGVLAASNTLAFQRYQDGCNIAACHGDFTDSTSTKGSIFPGGDKHTMHRSSQNMNADCSLCHRSNDGNNPYIGISDGTANNPGIGCTGCHEENGLRAHHLITGNDCSGCHPNDPAPLPENTVPVYYGTPDVDAAMVDPCNLTGLSETDENWTIGDTIGTDNDGDGLYDGDDPDCATVSATPGEMPLLTVPSHDTTAQTFSVSYDATTCEQSSNNVFYGPLSAVSSYTYSGQGCSIGNTGSYSFDYSTISESIFFVVVAQNGTNEGSYGVNTAGAERPDALLCPETQLLTDRCDIP
jgi:hypothetical protein